MNSGFPTEAVARERAKKDMPERDVVIIESRGEFYVEPSNDAPMIRSWERECYTGKGKGAVPRKGYFTCRKCSAFNPHPADTCKRCGQTAAMAAAPCGL